MKKGFIKQLFIDSLEIVFISITVSIIVYVFLGQLLEITGDSMYPNFKDKEQLLAEKITLKFNSPQRGEIIIFKHPLDTERLLIKRVIGLPNETIKIQQGYVYINGDILDESKYLDKKVITNEMEFLEEGKEYKIPQNSYILLGDNRTQSTDSRAWGPVDEDLLLGRGIIVYFPSNSIRLINSK